jgi:hypothetical protein
MNAILSRPALNAISFFTHRHAIKLGRRTGQSICAANLSPLS